MPIAAQVAAVLTGEATVNDALSNLMGRPLSQRYSSLIIFKFKF